MKLGIDYWHVCSDYPIQFRELATEFLFAENEVHIISAIGRKRIGTIKGEIDKLAIPYTEVHELVFSHPKESPYLKLRKCQELGISFFWDDREDVCHVLNDAGILAFRVERRFDVGDIESDLR